MKRLILCLAVFAVALVEPTSAKVVRKRKRVRRGPASEVSTTAPAAEKTLPKMLLVRGGLLLSQEAINVYGTDSQTTMEAQFQGLGLSVLQSVPFGRTRFSRVYAGELGLGVVKGKANGADLNDAVKGQPFYSLAGAAGLSYITSPVSRIAIMVPLVFRQIKWKTGDADGFDPDRDTSFSVGLSGVFETRFSIRSSLIVSATWQHLWQSTTFGLAYQRRLR